MINLISEINKGIIQYIQIIKPKTYDKVTWILVISGLGMLTNPIWIEIANQYFKTNFGLNYTGNNTIIGIFLIIIALCYHVHMVKVNKSLEATKSENLNEVNTKRLFSILDLSYHGLNLKHYTDVLFGEFGFMVQEDPRQIEVICSIIESACVSVCSESEQNKIISQIKHFESYLMSYVNNKKFDKFHWKLSDDNAERIAGQIKSIEHTLKGKELLVFRIGELVGNWNRYEFEKETETPISESFLNTLTSYISKLGTDQYLKSIEALINNYKTNHADVASDKIANNVYIKIKQSLMEIAFE
jgi:hypothetical protein